MQPSHVHGTLLAYIPRNGELFIFRQPITDSFPLQKQPRATLNVPHPDIAASCHNYPGVPSFERLPFGGSYTAIQSKLPGSKGMGRFLLLLLPCPAQENPCQVSIPPTGASSRNMAGGSPRQLKAV